MGRNNWFEFKQFRIEQQRSAMKVGTDGVLLGSWTPVKNAQRILDVGTGTGIVALMLAQRSKAQIDAVEIDSLAATEAKFNFDQSAWKHRLRVHNIEFQSFASASSQKYDLIVSNPPFFTNSLKTSDPALTLARHNDSLPFDELILGAHRLLTETGRFCVIIPIDNFTQFRESARLVGFYLGQLAYVIPKTGKAYKRILLEFTVEKGYPEACEIVILDPQGEFTDQFKSLTSPYYPAF